MTSGWVARSGGVRGMPLSRRDTWKAALSVPLPGLWQCKRACAAKVCVAVVSRSVFLSGQAAKKNYEHPQRVSPAASLLACTGERARVRNLAEIASTHMLLRGPPPPPPSRIWANMYVNTENSGKDGRENTGILAGLCLKMENSRVAAIIGSYPAILPV